jgi:hypothetical protein
MEARVATIEIENIESLQERNAFIEPAVLMGIITALAFGRCAAG